MVGSRIPENRLPRPPRPPFARDTADSCSRRAPAATDGHLKATAPKPRRTRRRGLMALCTGAASSSPAPPPPTTMAPPRKPPRHVPDTYPDATDLYDIPLLPSNPALAAARRASRPIMVRPARPKPSFACARMPRLRYARRALNRPLVPVAAYCLRLGDGPAVRSVSARCPRQYGGTPGRDRVASPRTRCLCRPAPYCLLACLPRLERLPGRVLCIWGNLAWLANWR